TITEYADSHGCDCIIIMSHQPGLQDYFLGSTAARVVRHAHCAVHVMR
ncbi:MAG: universal stress protein, partial [Alphaproteobacteria bacterium]|nr:universal stress protein [Alphaproteobacteria bacterium]